MRHCFKRALALLLAALLACAVAAAGAVADGEALPEFSGGAEAKRGAEADALDLSGLAGYEAPMDEAIDLGGNGVYREGGEPSVLLNGGTLTASPDEIELERGDSAEITVTYTLADGTVYWSSSDESVAQCEWASGWNGNENILRIFAVSEGSAIITVTNDRNEDSAQIKVTVKAKKTLSVDPASVTVKAGESATVTVRFMLDGEVYWRSNNNKVATCVWGENAGNLGVILYIKGMKKGSATITLTNDQNDEKVKVKVKVKQGSARTYPGKGKKDGSQTCRALLIGEEGFKPVCTRNRGDVALMTGMLRKVRSSRKSKWSITRKYDLDSGGVKNAIYRAFKAADEDDVSLFFIATHGNTNSSRRAAGALAMVPRGTLFMDELADALKAVPGKIIVIIESCGAGAGVYISDEEQNGAPMEALKKAAEAFDGAAIAAFAAADEPVAPGEQGRYFGASMVDANTGELRVKYKFYVLAASRYHEYSWGTESGPYNYFTKWLTDGIGVKGSMPADANRNGVTTLKELFNYISDVGDNYAFQDEEGVWYQHVQVYPKNSAFKLFRRK